MKNVAKLFRSTKTEVVVSGDYEEGTNKMGREVVIIKSGGIARRLRHDYEITGLMFNEALTKMVLAKITGEIEIPKDSILEIVDVNADSFIFV